MDRLRIGHHPFAEGGKGQIWLDGNFLTPANQARTTKERKSRL